MATQKNLENLSRLIRSAILRSTTAAGSGHPTSSLSAVELMTALFFGGVFRSRLDEPAFANNDRFVLSKGHASPLLYALYHAAGKVSEKELLSLRKFGSVLEGHPSILFSYTEAPTGSLGQGLSIGLGIALAGRLHKLSYRTYVLLGDSEMAEGSVWEALQLAAHEKVDSLTAILDVNRLGQSGPTMLGHNIRAYARRVQSFGWKTIVLEDGHDLRSILSAYRSAIATKSRPTMIIAKTIKGKGVSFLENKNGWHGKALSQEQCEKALFELGSIKHVVGKVAIPRSMQVRNEARRLARQPKYTVLTSVRKACGNALVRLACAFPNLVVLDAELKNSTFTELFEKSNPDRFVETYIAEQNMVGIAIGLASRGFLPVSSTYAAFFTRAFDQLRMASYAGTHQASIGTHAGISVGQDGFSQMGLEDIAMFRTLANCSIFYPSDAYSAERLVELALRSTGLAYVRATRAELPLLYDAHTPFRIGGSRTLRSSKHDKATIVAAGITVHEALQAADVLAGQGTKVRVIDCYSIKPIDARTLLRAAEQTKHLIVVEDHRPEGGIVEAVRSALGSRAGCVRSLAVTHTPHSGMPEQLLAYEGIDADGIVAAIHALH